MRKKHIEFWVSDIKRSVKFYKGFFKILGWKNFEKNAFVFKDPNGYILEVATKSKTIPK